MKAKTPNISRNLVVGFIVAVATTGCKDTSPGKLASTYLAATPENRRAMVSQKARDTLGELVAIADSGSEAQPTLTAAQCEVIKTQLPEFVRVLCTGTSIDGKNDQKEGVVLVREAEQWRVVPFYKHSKNSIDLVNAKKWDEACSRVDRFLSFAPVGRSNFQIKIDCLLRVAAVDHKQHKSSIENAKIWLSKFRVSYPDPDDAKILEDVADRLAQVEANPPFVRPPLSPTQIKGDAARLVGRTALVYAYIQPHDYFNYGYAKMRPTMFSFRVRGIQADGKPSYDDVNVYAEKAKFQGFFDDVARSSEPQLATMVIGLPGDRYAKNSSSEFSLVEARLGRAHDLDPDSPGLSAQGDTKKSWSAKFRMEGKPKDSVITGKFRALGARLRIELDGVNFVHLVDTAKNLTWSFDPTAKEGGAIVWGGRGADIAIVRQSFKCAEAQENCFSQAGLAAKGKEVVDGMACDVLENLASPAFLGMWEKFPAVTQTIWRPTGLPSVPYLRVRTGWVETNLKDIVVGRESADAFVIPNGLRILSMASLTNLKSEEFPDFERIKASFNAFAVSILKTGLPPK